MSSSFDLGNNYFNYTDCHNIDNHDDFIFISKSHSITDNNKKYFRTHKKNINKLFKLLQNNDLHLHENFNNNTPIKPYFHLYSSNISDNFDNLVLSFINTIIHLFNIIFNLTLKKTDFTILNNSHDNIFSLHIILHKKYFFHSNIQQFKFIKHLEYIFINSFDLNNNHIYHNFIFNNSTIFNTKSYNINQNSILINQTNKYNTFTLKNDKKTFNPHDFFIVEYNTHDKTPIDISLLDNYITNNVLIHPSNNLIQKIINNINDDIINDIDFNSLFEPGFLYILSNPLWTIINLFKIGCTINIDNRLSQYTTALPDPCIVEHLSTLFIDKLFFEYLLSLIFHNKRYNINREFYNVTINDFIQKLQLLYIINNTFNTYDLLLPFIFIYYKNYFTSRFNIKNIDQLIANFYHKFHNIDLSHLIIPIPITKIKTKNIIAINELDFYNNILTINTTQHKEILNVIRSGNADLNTKLISKKYIFQYLVTNNTSNDIKANIFYNYFYNEFQKHILLNLFTEKNNNDAHKFIIDDFFKANFLIEHNKIRGLKFDYILQINKLLGLKHSHDTDTIINVKIINDNIQWFSDNLQNINHIFSLSNTVNNNTVINKLIIVKLIKKIYSSWSNSIFVPNTIDRNKIAINYKLHIDTTLWTHIKTHNI